ncbi:MAG: hypothetical protein ACP5N2_06325 [Candidatus Nanoarchaeia archaeon]
MVETMLDKKSDANKAFFCENGVTFHTIRELKDALPSFTSPELMTIFNKHVTPHKNDFAIWMGDVFGAYDLADKIYSINNPRQMFKVIEGYEHELKATETFEKLSDVESSKFMENLKNDISVRSDKAELDFEKIKNLRKRSIYNKADTADSIESLKNTYADFQSRLSELRKEGKDVSIPVILLRNILPKISYYQVSQNIIERDNIFKLFEEVNREMEYASSLHELDIRKEILEASKLNSEKKEER